MFSLTLVPCRGQASPGKGASALVFSFIQRLQLPPFLAFPGKLAPGRERGAGTQFRRGPAFAGEAGLCVGAHGNNNAFCQNNEISWFDWTLAERHADVLRFVKLLIAFRMNRDLPIGRHNMTLNELLRHQPAQWHGVKLNMPDWGHQSHTLAATVRLLGYPLLLHLIINAYWEALEFEIPVLDPPQASWRRVVDTYRDPPDDICRWVDAPTMQGTTCRVEPRSIVLLAAAMTGKGASAV